MEEVAAILMLLARAELTTKDEASFWDVQSKRHRDSVSLCLGVS